MIDLVSHARKRVGVPAVRLHTLRGPGDWLKANVNATGFFRVGYSDDLWRRIAAAAGEPAQQQLFSQVLHSCTPTLLTCKDHTSAGGLHACSSASMCTAGALQCPMHPLT